MPEYNPDFEIMSNEEYERMLERCKKISEEKNKDDNEGDWFQ
jgi:hypothetical protein